MALEPVFAGLVVDEFEQPVAHTFVGSELCYIVDDDGFKRHIPAEQIDRQVESEVQSAVSAALGKGEP